MPAAISDYLQRPSGGNVVVLVGTWVQLVNNISGKAYVSAAATDANGKFTVNNVPAGTYTVNTGPTNTGPWTSTGDTSYVVADQTLVVNVKDFGAKGDGVTDDAAAITSALTACSAAGGGVTWMPSTTSTYRVGSQIVVPYGVELRGPGRSAVQILALGT